MDRFCGKRINSPKIAAVVVVGWSARKREVDMEEAHQKTSEEEDLPPTQPCLRAATEDLT